jgi:hypothetical protein
MDMILGIAFNMRSSHDKSKRVWDIYSKVKLNYCDVKRDNQINNMNTIQYYIVCNLKNDNEIINNMKLKYYKKN